jgi:folate-binding protein YgfZ
VFLRALVTGDAVLLEMPEERMDAIERLLVHYKVAAPVRFARVGVAAALGLLGPRAAEVLRKAGAEVGDLPAEAHVQTRVGGVEARVVRAGDLPADGHEVLVSPADAPAARAALAAAGAVEVSEATLDALRIEDGRPWYGVDVTEDNLLHETGLVAEYHSAAKGCYVGQEVIARLEARGANVNKLLRGIRLSDPALAGAAVSAEGREVGRITTAAVSPRLGPIAMGYLHRSRSVVGAGVEVDGRPATVAALPLGRD